MSEFLRLFEFDARLQMRQMNEWTDDQPKIY